MRNVLVCTVGTSLKGNLERAKKEKFSALLTQRNTQGIVLELSKRDPKDCLAGAEINSITSILKKGLLGKRLKLYFLISDTEDGALIGDILKTYYQRKQNPFSFEHVAVSKIEGLTDQSPLRFRTEGLRNLVRAIAQIVRRHHSQSVLINATGGYKAQISFAGMIGQALEIPVCYLFEKFSEVIELPPQPISMDLSFWLEHAPLFFELAGEGIDADPTEKDARFASLVEKIEENGLTLVCLSATGQLFHETFQYRFHKQREALLPADSSLEPEKKIIKYEDNNAGKHPGLKTHLENISRKPFVVRIFTHYYNPDLSLRNYFRRSAKGEICQIEGGFSDGKATTKFDIVTTARNAAQRDAAIAELLNNLCA